MLRSALVKWLAASCWIFSKFPDSNQSCYTAPVWG